MLKPSHHRQRPRLTLESCSSLLCCVAALLGFLFSLAVLGLIDFHSHLAILRVLGRSIDCDLLRLFQRGGARLRGRRHCSEFSNDKSRVESRQKTRLAWLWVHSQETRRGGGWEWRKLVVWPRRKMLKVNEREKQEVRDSFGFAVLRFFNVFGNFWQRNSKRVANAIHCSEAQVG